MVVRVGNAGNESLSGNGNENDVIWGAGGQDTLRGGQNANNAGGGNDLLDGGTGSDQIFGGDGNDTLIGGFDTVGDTLNGGSGTDTADYSQYMTALTGGGVPTYAQNNTAMNVNLAAGTATGLGSDSLDSIENVRTGGGADTILGTTGANLLSGGGGADSIDGAAGLDTLFGGAGNDALFGGADVDQLFGGIDDDLLDGGAGADSLFGGTGRDTLIGGAAADTLDGGLGFDTADYSSSANAVNVNLNTVGAQAAGGDASGDVLIGIEGLIGSDDTVTGDNLTGNGRANVIDGGAGNDTITGGEGGDSILGGDGDDQIVAGPDAPTVTTATPQNLEFDWTSAGRDDGDPLGAGVTQTIGGVVQFNATYIAGNGNLFAIEENDFDLSSSNPSTFFRPTGTPAAIENNSAAILARPGVGEITELTFNFSAVAGQGVSDEVSNIQFVIADVDSGNGGNQYIDRINIRAFDALGNPVPVTITTQSTVITFNNGAVTSITTLDAQVLAQDNFTTTGGNAQGSVLVTVPGPASQIQIQYDDADTGTGSLQSIYVSNVTFTTVPLVADGDDDTVSGGAGNDFVEGGYGNDSLVGDEGNDILLGEAGNDALFGGIGADSLDGGDGNDLIEGGDDNDTILGGSGNDTVFGGVGADSIDGGVGDDSLYYGAGDDTVFGGEGNDVIDDVDGDELGGVNLLYGGAGDDRVWAGDGADSLFGDAGNDTLYGEDGDDTIVGGSGNDTMFGGAGLDVFVINLGDQNDSLGGESIDGGGTLGADSTVDFDTIDLSAFGWSRVDIRWTGGNPGSESGFVLLLDELGNEIGRIDFSEIEKIIPCFTPGTMILTDQGERPVESLLAGDLVMTRDNGLQPLRWVGRRVLSLLELMAQPTLKPVEIATGALGVAGPERVMRVSPQHRVLVEGARAELLFGETEVLVPARHLLGMAGIRQVLPLEGVTYIHLLLDRHEIVQSDGIWSESFQPAERMVTAMDRAARDEVLGLFPGLAEEQAVFGGARLSLSAHEARALFES